MLFGNMTAALLIARLTVLVVAFTVHEFAHAWSADTLGDNTPRMHGRLTLNPLAHLDPLGSLMLLFSGFGWAKPVPVNPYALQRRTPAGLMLVALAGPLSNLVLAIGAAIPFKMGWVNVFGPQGTLIPTASQLLSEFVWINLILMLFNLIPLAPLDGEKVAMYLFPEPVSDFLNRIRPYSILILILLMVPMPIFGGRSALSLVISEPINNLFWLLVG